MGDQFLYIMPADPLFVPSPTAIEASIALITAAFPNSPVRMELCSGLEVYHPMQDWESGACPACAAPVPDEWWFERAAAAYSQGAAGLVAPLPCCGTPASINDLRSDVPSRVARCAVCVHDHEPGGPWPDWTAFDQHAWATAEAVGHVWGCAARHVWKHI